MSDTNDRVELVIPLGDDVTTAHQMMANSHPDRIVFRGDRAQVGRIALHLLVKLTGREYLFDKLDVDDLVTALHTLGELNRLGLDVDLDDELSERQKDVMDLLGRITADAGEDAGE